MSIETTTESLERLVQILDLDLGEVDALPTGGESAQLIRVSRSGEIAIRSLDGEHPFDALLGFVAPDDWEVFGVIAPGWGTFYAGRRKGERRRMRAIHVVSRGSDEASLLRFAGESPVIAKERVPGRVADCLRRCLDVATAPAGDDSLVRLWWERTLQQLVARRHPSFGDAPVTLPEIEGILAACRPTSWADERWTVAMAGGDTRMDGALATWMDDGMFARFVLDDLTDPEVAMPAAKRACTPEAWDYMLRCFVAAFGGP